MANILTGGRIVCALLLLLSPAFSKRYFVFYLLGGFTDAIDGTVARRLGTQSSFGAKFDTAADFVFALAAIIKIAANLYLPAWLLIWIGVIFAVKLSGVIIGAVKQRRLVAVHSVMNKLCGGVVYAVPLFIGADIAWQIRMLALIFACVFATAAAICELKTIVSGEDAE